MKNPLLLNKKYLQATLMLPVLGLLAFAGCTSIESTGEHQKLTNNRVATYMEQS